MKHRTVLVFLIIATLFSISCGVVGTLFEKAKSPTPTTQPSDSGSEAPTSTPKPASSGEQQPTPTLKTSPGSSGEQQPTPTPKTSPGSSDNIDLGGLKSCRMSATETNQESNQVNTFTTELVIDPFALSSKTDVGGRGGVEIIVVDNTMWVRIVGMGDMGWTKTELDQAELSDWESLLKQGQAAGELPEGPPWPKAIKYLPGQVPLPVIEGSLKPEGTETINGIKCTKYSFDSEYDYEFTAPAPVGKVETTIKGTGTLWVADQGNLPPIIIQADVTKTDRTKTAQGEGTTTVHIEHQVTDINVPIAIEPPKE